MIVELREFLSTNRVWLTQREIAGKMGLKTEKLSGAISRMRHRSEIETKRGYRGVTLYRRLK